MRQKRIFLKIYPTYILIILLFLLGSGGCVYFTLRNFYIAKSTKELEIRARLLQSQLIKMFPSDSEYEIDRICKTLGQMTSNRITIILPGGEVLADSEGIPQLMDNHKERPEVKEALAGRTGISIHYSRLLYEDMLYIAVPWIDKGKVIGVIRIAEPVTEINKELTSLYIKIALGGFIAAILAAIISFMVSREISRPIIRIKEGAKLFASGKFSEKLKIPDIEELASLAAALNLMAQNLDEKIRLITNERNEREVILSSMREGVLAVDAEGRILTLNDAVEKMFGIQLSEAKGRPLLEVIRNIDLRRFISKSIQSKERTEAEIILPGQEKIFLQVHGSALRNADGDYMGTLVVLNDITRIRQLENIRKEFIANVSHEIKTPITSIMACIETLTDELSDSPETIHHLLDILSRQTNRLNSIIDNLLKLSRIEWIEQKGEIKLEEVKLYNLLQKVIQERSEYSSLRKMKIILQCDSDFKIKVNSSLLEQAVANLLDNAIEYSDADSSIIIQGYQDQSGVIIKVIDHGCGIAKEHLSRIFERFYRVHKDRSRQSGGTGLGLAIVKHIINAHGGSVSVESTPGKGSVFTIKFPISCSA